MRIIHLSDLHVNKEFKRGNIKKLKSALSHVQKIGFDHLVITGDLSDNATEDDFSIIRQVFKNLNLLDSSKLSVVIGNHDIFGGVQSAIDVLEFPNKCKQVNYEYKVSKFVSYFEELFTDCKFPASNKFFPYYKNLGAAGIIGINSVAHYSKISNPLASTGKIYSEQLNDLQMLLVQADFKQPKLALVHHHFYKKNFHASSPQNKIWSKVESYSLRLRNKKKVIRVLKDYGIRLVLHGHSHEVKQYDRKGIHFINAGGSIENENNTTSFFIIDLQNEKANVILEKVPLKKTSETVHILQT